MINQLYKLCAPCLFGLESVLSGELKRLGFEDISVTDGRVEFTADAEGIARANLIYAPPSEFSLSWTAFGLSHSSSSLMAQKKSPSKSILVRKTLFQLRDGV